MSRKLHGKERQGKSIVWRLDVDSTVISTNISCSVGSVENSTGTSAIARLRAERMEA
eukprot:CAMPEP_0179116120 /NCGR_PEP_ID=MMETSP0796-20121207/54448_1 /TAXON_ID=73915 /ORGANISM="Pyrodinium bahamense, Strain pbaha01" /LENGTH=56 /DNA_ID=CAMNT_0020814385 /DNA_START=29 /DNA_END=202 /DNA_ORIENTATION=+